MTLAELEERLLEAGATLIALRAPGLYPSQRLVAPLPVVHDWQAYGWTGERPAMPQPTNLQISRMDEVLGWLNAYLPRQPATFKLIVGARMLVHPLTGRQIWTWRALGRRLGADHKAVIRWHGQALTMIVKGLAHPPHKTLYRSSRSHPCARSSR